MRWLIDFSVRRPVAVAMAYCALGLLALAAWGGLAIDVTPEGEYPEVTISTNWPGSSPESVQSLVTSPIETVALGIPDVHKVTSISQRGSSAVTVQFLEDANLDLARFELADRLSLLHDDLPAGVQPPNITYALPRQYQEFQSTTFLDFTLRAPRDLNDLRRLAVEDVRDGLLSVEGVAEVEVFGGQDPHLRITLDPDRLELYGLQARDVHRRIGELNAELPVGAIELSGTAWVLRIEQVLEDLAPLRALPLERVGDRMVRLSDLGTVEFGFEKAERYTRVNGEPLVQVQITRKPGTDVLGVARAVRTRLDRLRVGLPADVTIEILADEAAELEQELSLVSRRLAMVLVLVAVLIVVLLRDLKSAPLLFTSIGAALAMTVVALYHLQVPVNVLTLTGLALAFGMLVDNAVVVLENIMRYREQGATPPVAARRGTSEVIVPVLASTLTTIGVFFPFIYFQGRMRDYFAPLGIAIGLALTASLVVAISLMPAAAARGWMSGRVKTARGGLRWFRSGLGLALRYPVLVMLMAGAGWYGSYRLFDENVARGDFFGWWGAREEIRVFMELQSGAEASRTDRAMRPFEEYVLGLDEVERVEVQVAGNSASMRVKFPPEIEVTAYPLVVKDELIRIATRYAGMRISVSGFDQNGYFSGAGGSSWMNSRIRLYGYNYEELGRIGEEIARVAERSARVRESRVTAGSMGYWGDQGGELMLRLRRDALARHGLTVQDVNRQLATLLAGEGRERLRLGEDEWNLQVKVDGVDRRTLDELLATPVRGAADTSIRMRDVLEVQLQRIPGAITREDQRYDRFVQWEYRGSTRAAENYRRAIFDSLSLPPGYSASLDDSRAFTSEEQLQLRKVAILALIIVFMVLASLYESLIQPLVVLLAVPGALVGVFLIFWYTGEAFDAAASIGVVLLGGIVVNNAILLVDHINLRRQELPLVDAILTATVERVRPILITSITTVGGMLPLVLIEAEAEMRSQDIWGSLALSTIGGLTASTLLTLTLTPVLYLLVERARRAGGRLARRTARVWRTLPA